ncbi:uncharacterized protein LOC120829717 isoform X1 [Gasterosteus aculeatus]
MHQRSPSELQGASRRRAAARAGAPLWTWLLLGFLALPGARSYLSEEQEELLVELHNHYRGQVSPSASAMLPLRWDPSLKIIAEGYAAKCIWNHNPELEDTGENLFVGTGPLDLREALEKWFLERQNFDFQNNTCDEDQMCGHYTQMVWADTHRVGCAFHLCNNMEGLDWERASFLVCNYYPAGNYDEQRPFVEGEWCSRCPDNFQKCENNLCVADTMEDDDDEAEDVDEEEGAVPPLGTSGPSLQPEGEKDQEAVVPPSGTTGPSIQPEGEKDQEGTTGPSIQPEGEKDQEAVVPPSGTTGPSIQPEGEKDQEGTTGPSIQPEGEKDQEAVVPPPGTNGPSIQPEGEKELEAVVPPPATSGPSLQPEGKDVGPNVHPPTITPTSTPSNSTIIAEGDSDDLQPPATPAPGTQPPEFHPTPEEKENKGADKIVEVKKKVPFKEKAVKEERDGKRNLSHSQEASMSAASASSPPLLLACLTGLLTLRL